MVFTFCLVDVILHLSYCCNLNVRSHRHEGWDVNGAANDAASEGCEFHEIMKFTSLRNWEFPL